MTRPPGSKIELNKGPLRKIISKNRGKMGKSAAQFILVLLSALLILSGCMAKVETKRYPEAGIDAPVAYKSVAILRSPPSRAYQALGEIHLQSKDAPSQKAIFKKLKKAAAKMGADAVVLVADPAGLTQGPVANLAEWKGGLETAGARTIIGVAIWYPRPAW